MVALAVLLKRLREMDFGEYLSFMGRFRHEGIREREMRGEGVWYDPGDSPEFAAFTV
ncbi:MAG: hypothetical protein L7W43_08805 [Rubripirellula sp.]|nr:hypothetical protein [Rubripirellula sp.]